MAGVTARAVESTGTDRTESQGLSFPRFFTEELKASETPYDVVRWELRSARITDSAGNIVFEQKDVEVPLAWSQTATNIAASKYFHGRLGSEERESSIRQLISRVANRIAAWGAADCYFD